MKTWVIGRGGLLGRSVEQRLASFTEVFVPSQKFDWSDSARVTSQLATECQSFFSTVGDDNWTIYWCAGRGTLSSSPDQMHAENEMFKSLLQALESSLSAAAKQKGTIFFASSAGAVYGGSKNPPFTELTQPKSLTSYGDAKIYQEELLKNFAIKNGVRVLVGRISNVYGARQDLAKNQGLISTICFSVLRRQPLNLFVPLETSRNYIYVEDAAKCIITHTQKNCDDRHEFKFRSQVSCGTRKFDDWQHLKYCKVGLAYATVGYSFDQQTRLESATKSCFQISCRHRARQQVDNRLQRRHEESND